MKLFCFGLGYVSSFITKGLNFVGSHTGKRDLNFNEYVFNNQTKFSSKALENVTHILISIPPNENGDPVYLSYIDAIRELPKLKWIGYLSSTSVYGDHQGEWVNEESSIDWLHPLGKNRLLAEKQWLSCDLPVNIFRLSAIYGPGRSTMDLVRSGKAVRILKKGHFFSRIHVEDITQIILSSMDKFSKGEIYNLSDDLPSPQHELISYACQLLKLPEPPLINFEDANLTSSSLLYYSSNRKISNKKIKDHYDIKLLYPTYKDGLLSCFRGR